MSKHFTPSQAKSILSKQKRVRWGIKDISQGLVLRTLSKRAYQYIRYNKIFPIPAISTLRKWINNYKCPRGIQTSILKIMQQSLASESKNSDNVASLSFDEMEIKKEYQYDPRSDQFLGPYKKLQLAILRGIASNWKQPIFYDFDSPMTKDLLFSIIIAAENHSIQIHNIVCDLGNQSLLKSLEVSQEKPFFANPFCPDRKVFVFADAPHLLKLLRNHLLDKEYRLQNGTEIKKENLQKILAIDSGELKIHHKLLPIHFNCTHSTRQRVSLAAQLISHTTASALRCLFNDEKTADWIEMFDNWFDIFNSRITYSSKKMGCAFGIHLDEQKSVLEKVASCVETMREIGRKSLLPFQKGLLMSIKSLLGLFEELKKIGVNYILTARLNQDVAENTFSQIRGFGSTHPGPVDCINRLRLIILGKNGKILVENPSVILEVEDETTANDFDTRAQYYKNFFHP